MLRLEKYQTLGLKIKLFTKFYTLRRKGELLLCAEVALFECLKVKVRRL